MRRSSVLWSISALALVLGSAPATARVLARVSVSSAGEPNIWDCLDPTISSDGRYVAFYSYAWNLVPGDTNDEHDVFLHDCITGETTRVSVSSTGEQADGDSGDWSLSLNSDGRLVLFNSNATNLVAGAPGGQDLYVHDRVTGETMRVPRPPDQGYGLAAPPAVISADGRYVWRCDKVMGDGGALPPYWVVSIYDRPMDTLTELFRGDDYIQSLSVSADSRFVAYRRFSVPGDGGHPQVYVYDRQTSQQEMVSVSGSGVVGDLQAGWARISPDGRWVAFDSQATNLVPDDTNAKWDAFVRDRQTGETERVSVSSSEEEANDQSEQPRISADGRFVVFGSYATNLITGDTNGRCDVFVRDRSAGETIRVNVDAAGNEANDWATQCEISADGRSVVFMSSATNLVATPPLNLGPFGDDIFLASNDGANAPPSQPTVDVTPDAPNTNDDLACAITEESTDPDEDPVTYSYRWYKDDVQQSAYDDLTTVPSSATAPGEAWKCVVTPNDGTEDGPSGQDQVTIGSPSLNWAGTAGYESDGVDPDTGDPKSTTFTFKVKYTDPTGDAPTKARVIISKLTDAGWELYRNLGLTLESGDVETGAIYSCSTELPNYTLKHVFMFQAGDGSSVGGPPTIHGDGPFIIGRPCVAYPSQVGYVDDGVEPNSGPLGTSFQFRVKYYDSAGDAPTTCDLVLRRNGNVFRCKAMQPLPVGDLRLGQVYRTWVVLDKQAVYEYRFHFADVSGNALGPPNNFASGPLITGGSGDGMVSSLTAVPTAAGAQITFSLSSPASVTATVVNVAGRPIAAIVADKPLEAGLQTLVWNRMSTSGLPVPAGVYLIRVTARADDGSQSSALGTISLR